MSAGIEDAVDGEPSGSSGGLLSGHDVILPIAGHLAQYAARSGQGLSASSAIQIALRKADGRSDLLEQVVFEICPQQANEDLWREWIEGEGPSPFDARPKSLGKGKERPSQTLARASDRVEGYVKSLAQARQEVGQAEAKVAKLERLLLESKNLESAAVHWHVVSQLVAAVSPVFAMGPGWTVMRALSAHLSDALADDWTDLHFGDSKAEAIAEIKKTREEETRLALELLDLGSGVDLFEDDLRTALMGVVRAWDKRRPELMADGRKPRGQARAKTRVHPRAERDADEVFAGLKTVG